MTNQVRKYYTASKTTFVKKLKIFANSSKKLEENIKYLM